jgi:hypothetical protein
LSGQSGARARNNNLMEQTISAIRLVAEALRPEP